MQATIQTHLSENDEVLKTLVQQLDWPETVSTHNVFHDLMSCVIEQQIHYRSTKGIFNRLLHKAGLKELTPKNFETFEENGLAGFKLSARKYETIAALIDYFASAPDFQSLNDKEIQSQLGGIKGIGDWTIEMILMFTLERPDRFPFQDYHLKQIMTKLYEIDQASRLGTEMKQIAENWRPYRSLAVQYLWAWKKANK